MFATEYGLDRTYEELKLVMVRCILVSSSSLDRTYEELKPFMHPQKTSWTKR